MKLILINVLDLCIVFFVLKFFSGDREKALPIDQSQSKEISSVYQYKGHCIQIGTPANFVQWPLLKYVARELKVCRGATQLEQFNNYFSRPFYCECLLNDYIIYLRTYEKWYYVIVFIVIIVKTMFRFWPRSPSTLNQPRK